MKEGNRNHSRYFQAERNFIQRIRTYQGHWKSPKDEVEAVNSGNAASWLRLLPPSQLPQTLEAGDVTTVGPGAQLPAHLHLPGPACLTTPLQRHGVPRASPCTPGRCVRLMGSAVAEPHGGLQLWRQKKWKSRNGRMEWESRHGREVGIEHQSEKLTQSVCSHVP